ncbi:hypothetical protein [Falsigemmobacter faecalis]|uniref:Uncharacterized protein n=1 Tax=Falsigemmobacter faecalis TaxID=2488730 RepID=A0A3P3DDR7_9RHOB|nr:hypothetical protein [Falsigemmobacter faecalis]RRH71984.1 hypothetical protein EG244_15840 [Falsigemmobacter faecalis]
MRLFQDAAGTIPAYEAGQPVGKVARAAGTIDATQATALSRPTLARMPKGGRRNLLITTTSFDAWGKARAIGYPAVDGWLSFGPTEANAQQQVHTAVGQGARSYSFYVRRDSKPFRVGFRAAHNTGTNFGAATLYPATAQAGNSAVVISEVTETSFKVTGAAVHVNEGASPVFYLRFDNVEDNAARVWLRDLQVDAGPATPYQVVVSASDIIEPGIPDVWHLFNDGGDSLLAPLPTGTYEVATVGIDGKPHYASLTGDGSGKNILLGADRIADIFVRPGALTDAERLRLEEYWQQRYGAGYLIPPGMPPGARLMRQESTGNTPAAVSQPVGLLALSASNVFGPELRDGSVAATTGSPTVASQINTMTGDGRVHRDDASNIGSVRMPDLEPGATYEISFSQITGGTLSFRQASSSGSIVGSATEANPRAVFTAASTVNFVSLSANGTTISFTGMSLRKVNAPITRQETALSRPTLARWPKGGRRNLIANTFGIATVAGVTATIVEPGVWELNNLGAAAGQRADWSVPADRAPPGSTLTFSVEVKSAGEYGSLAMTGIRNSAGASVSQAAYVERLTDSWQRMVATLTLGADNTNGAQLRINNRSGDVNKVLVRNPQIEIGPAATPYQAVASITDITEAGVPDVWHLYNDGGDSLPAVLPAGAYEIAWVNHLGVIGYASVTSDGTTGTDLLRAERMADVAVKRGRFTSYEKAQLETQWGKYKP